MAGRLLRVEVLAETIVHWSVDDWRTVHETHSADTRLGIHFADLPTHQLAPGRRVRFIFFWPDAQRWERADFEIAVTAAR